MVCNSANIAKAGLTSETLEKKIRNNLKFNFVSVVTKNWFYYVWISILLMQPETVPVNLQQWIC